MNPRAWQRKVLLAVLGCAAFLVVAGTLISSFQLINKPFPGFFLYRNLSVAPDFLPHWSGRREGLRFLDRVIAVQGQPVTEPRTIYELMHRHPAGSPFEYTVEREKRQFPVTIPSMKFSFYDWLLTFGVYLLSGVGFLIIGATPFYLRSTSPAASPLFFMVSSIFFWFGTTFDFMTTQVVPKEVRILAFTLTPSAGIHLGLALTRGWDKRKGRLLTLIAIYGVSLLVGFAYRFTFSGPVEFWHLALRSGYGYSCLAAIIFLGLLWTSLRRPIPDLERSRLRVVLVGAVLGFFLPTLGTVLTSVFNWQIPYNLLLICAVFFPLSVAYALLKYSLFDLGAVLKVGLTGGALTGVLLLIYVAVVSLLGISVGIYDKDPLVPLFFSVLVVLVFNPLLRWIEGLVDRYIYRKEYDPVEVQREVSLLLRSLSRPRAVAEQYLKLVADRVGIERAYLLFQSGEGEIHLGISASEATNGLKEVSRDLGAFWVQHFGARRRGISKGEVEADPLYEGARRHLAGAFRELELEILIPITFEENILGFLCLGKKKSGRGYSADDFQLLCTLTDQLALSLKNGMLFEESEKAQDSYRLLYDESQVMNAKLIEADRLKKQFVANISHELRTPISTILGYSEVLLDPAFAGNTHVVLERVVSSGQDLSQLMDSLLDFSKMESGTIATSLQEVSLSEVFQSLKIMTEKLTGRRPIRLRVEIEPPIDVIETDSKKLQQILMQLLTNALKFTERGEIALEARPVLGGEKRFVEISVSDTGIGISKRDQEIVFEEFRQLDGSSTRRYGGTGLGLSLCRKLAQSLGGRIEVQSEIGKGSTFGLVLPLGGLGREEARGLQMA
jgi:signal transduction histidine kinase